MRLVASQLSTLRSRPCALGLDFMDNIPDHTKKSPLWHITEGQREMCRFLKFIIIADSRTSERLMAKSHPTFHLTVC